LPFAYPPIAAMVFYPLHLLPFWVVASAWQLGIVAAVYRLVRLSQRLLGGSAGGHRSATLWTAVGIWIEPLRSTFDWGQVNVFLAVAVLYAAYRTRWWVVRRAGWARRRDQTGTRHQRTVLPGCAPVGDRGFRGGGVRQHRRRVGACPR
jgi:hypothetical protein